MKNLYRTISNSTIILMATHLFFLAGISSCANHNRYIEGGELTTGTIYKEPHPLRLYSYSIHYEYFVNGVKYNGLKATTFNSELSYKLRGKQFPVIYVKGNPSESRMLMFEYDFDVLQLNYPDSLKWVEVKYSPIVGQLLRFCY